MAKDPAFLFYYKDILVSCAHWDADAVGWYTRLLCHQADKPEGLPTDTESLASLAGVKFSQYERFSVCWERMLSAKFEANEQGLLENKVMAEGLKARRLYKSKQAKRGIIGAFIKKIKSSHSLNKRQLKALCPLLMDAIKDLDNNELIQNTLKHTLEAYATSNKGNVNANGIVNEDEIKTEVHNSCKDIYQKQYPEHYWTAADAGAMNQLLAKIKFSVKAKNRDPEVETVPVFELIIKNPNDWMSNNGKIGVTDFNSHYDSIVKKIKDEQSGTRKNGTKHSQQHAELDEAAESFAATVRG